MGRPSSIVETHASPGAAPGRQCQVGHSSVGDGQEDQQVRPSEPSTSSPHFRQLRCTELTRRASQILPRRTRSRPRIITLERFIPQPLRSAKRWAVSRAAGAHCAARGSGRPRCRARPMQYRLLRWSPGQRERTSTAQGGRSTSRRLAGHGAKSRGTASPARDFNNPVDVSLSSVRPGKSFCGSSVCSALNIHSRA
jgi:hypothetical protein